MASAPAARGLLLASSPTLRRAALLNHLQVALLGLLAVALVALIAQHVDSRVELVYGLLIAALAAVLTLALVINLSGLHSASAGLTIAALIAPPWLSLALDTHVQNGDFIPMVYVVFPVMVAAMFVRVRTVAVLAISQLIGLTAVAFAAPHRGFNWASLLTFVVMVSVISALYSAIARQDLHQIDHHISELRSAQSILLYQASHDALTGAYNRAYLDSQLGPEIARSSRSGQPFSIVMFDIDHFKAINDHFGHAGGDDALRRVASTVIGMTRRADSVCRLGGDEFVVLLPEADTAGAAAVAEAVRATVARDEDTADAGTGLTLSLGIATCPNHGMSPDALLSVADSALYDAKRSGRNRVGRSVA